MVMADVAMSVNRQGCAIVIAIISPIGLKVSIKLSWLEMFFFFGTSTLNGVTRKAGGLRRLGVGGEWKRGWFRWCDVEQEELFAHHQKMAAL